MSQLGTLLDALRGRLSADDLMLLRDLRDLLDQLLAQQDRPRKRRTRPARRRPKSKVRLIGVVVL